MISETAKLKEFFFVSHSNINLRTHFSCGSGYVLYKQDVTPGKLVGEFYELLNVIKLFMFNFFCIK